ncbi:general stress protein [Caulobacter sp. RL271]|uniref:Uncharacterized protein n=1 Tax=Caulobacter segnis TaxID=88688 RepID=A0ABY4ZX36_9CAUL|nr:KGG domain-containing protein [Caulobacter segnis]USQ97263.1 hypothetical protein MZV50_06890 [Caulobacter segnis]
MTKKAFRGWAVTAAKNPELMRAIAAAGGAAQPGRARSFSKDPVKAVEAGRKGGLASGLSRAVVAEFEGAELADYRMARAKGFSVAEARGIVIRSRRP